MERVDVMLTDRGEVEVPESLRPQFEEEARAEGVGFRPARRVSVGGRVLAVAEEDREAFEKETAESGAAWEPVHTVRAGEETVQVPQSLAGEFLKEYRESPKFAAEREADRARVAREAGDPGSVVGAVLRGAAEGVVQAPRWWRETLEVLPQNFREGVNQATAMGADGDAAVGVLSAEEADAAQAAYREKAAKQGEDDTARRWFAEAAKMAGQQVRPLAAAAGAAGAVGLAAGASGVGAPSAVPAGMGAGAVTLAYGFYRQAAGEIYREARDQGLEHGTARAVALAAAVPFAALEKFQLTRLAQGLARRSVKGALVRRVAAELGAAGVRTVQEAAAEGAQETLKRAGVSAARVIDGELAAAALPRQLRDDFMAGVEEFGATLGPMAVMQVPGAVGGTAWQVVRERDAVRREGEFLRDALGESTGAAAEAEREARRAGAGAGTGEGDDFAQGRGGAGESGPGGRNEAGQGGAAGDEQAAGGGGAGGAGAEASAAGAAAGRGRTEDGGLRTVEPVALPERRDGARAEGIEVRQLGGRPVRGVRLLMPDGRALWTADPGEVALAEYWLKDRMLFPPSPAGDRGRQAGDPAVNAARRAGFELNPGKSVLVELGRSKRPYPATVVDVLDDGHVRLRVKIGTRSVKNNRAGYADVDVRQVRQWAGAAAKQKINERLARLGKEERAGVLAGARRFKELLLEGDELLDQEALAAADALPGREGGVARMAEMRKAYARAAAALDVEAVLNDPVEQARALPALEAWLTRARGGEETPEAVWLERAAEETEAERDRLEGVPFRFDSMTADEMIAEERRVAEAAERVERRRELERRAAAGISGTAGDMTVTLPGMEGTGDVPLFTETGNSKLETGAGGEMLANEEPGTPDARLATPGDQPGSVGGVRVTPHTVYNQDGSAGMEGEGRTVAPVAEGLQGVGMDLRDAVSLYRELRGLVPRIRKSLNGRALGWYKVKGREIELLASIFGLVDSRDAAVIRERLAHKGLTPEEVEAQVPAEINALVEIRRNSRMKMPVKVLTHELGHLVDALPDGMLRGRGNILGHVAALHRYMKQTLPRAPGEAGEVSGEEKARLWSEAEKMAERDLGKAREWVEEIRAEVKGLERVPVSAEDIKGILGLDGRERTPELYAWFARQDDGTKKDILKKAMKGLVDERAEGGAVREVLRTVVTGTRIRTEKTYSRADVSKRFRELLRKAVEDLRLIERDAIVAEARAAIPLWRGVEAAEKYFERPEEMYAELFGMFLSDPGWMEKNVPTAFRAYVAYMDARPEAKHAYTRWLHDKLDGTMNRKHMAALTETLTNAADRELSEADKALNTPGASQEWQAIRYAMDTRNGPIYVAVRKVSAWQERRAKRDLKAGKTTAAEADAERTTLTRRRASVVAGVKHISHGLGEVVMMGLDVKGRAKAVLDRAGVDWLTFDTYAMLNRIRYELDGRAAPGGVMPETAKEMLDELTAGMSDEQRGALSEAWGGFRETYEKHVVEAEGMRSFLGDQLHDLLRKNKYYVTFKHRPTRDDIKGLMEERKKAGEDAVAEGRPYEDGTTRFDIIASAMEMGTGSLGAKIYPLTGSFDPIASATVQTLQKGAALLNALHINNAKVRLRDYLRDYGYAGYSEIEIARAKDGSPIVRGEEGGRFGVVYYMEGGVIKAYRTDKYIAKAFESHRSESIRTINYLMKINNAMAGLQTRLRYGFWEPAYAKDRGATVANTPGMYRSPMAVIPFVGETPVAYLTRWISPTTLNKFPKWLINDRMFERWESTGWRTAKLMESGGIEQHLKIADELEAMGRLESADQLRREVLLLRRGLKLGITMQQQDLIPPSVGATPMDRHLMRYGLTEDVRRETDGFLKNTLPRVMKRLFSKYEKQGEIRENAVKFATLAYLDKNRPELTDDQKMIMVTEWGGSPDFSEAGLWKKYVEFGAGSFMNARKEGVKRSVTAMADHPVDFVAKKMAYSVGPAMLRAALASGLASYLIKLQIPDEDERKDNPLWKFAEFCRRGYSHVSDYLQKTYHVILLPLDFEGKAAAVLTLPMDETDMAWSDIAFTLVDTLCAEAGFDGRAGLKTANPISELINRRAADLLPLSANGGMLLGALMPFINTYLLGKNTYDEFRQKNILTQDEMDARFETWDAAGVLTGYAWNSSVGGLVKRWERPDAARPDFGRLHQLMNTEGVQPSVGRFLRVVSNGQQQMADVALARDDTGKTLARLEAKRILRESLRAGVYLLPEYESKILGDEYIREYYMRAYKEVEQKKDKKAAPFLINAIKSKTPETMQRLMDMHGNYQ